MTVAAISMIVFNAINLMYSISSTRIKWQLKMSVKTIKHIRIHAFLCVHAYLHISNQKSILSPSCSFERLQARLFSYPKICFLRSATSTTDSVLPVHRGSTPVITFVFLLTNFSFFCGASAKTDDSHQPPRLPPSILNFHSLIQRLRWWVTHKCTS